MGPAGPARTSSAGISSGYAPDVIFLNWGDDEVDALFLLSDTHNAGIPPGSQDIYLFPLVVIALC